MNFPPSDGKGAPFGEIAMVIPNQGQWSQEAYLDLSERTNRLIEMNEGCLEVPDFPGKIHQQITYFLLRSLDDFVRPNNLGKAILGAYP